ncbi:MAG: diacylglycerol kinase family protein [Ruminococcaceae bacterium]|nr:diacylglycerol kinase family protein [Oscillospiraceae bacterium]
MRVYVFYNPKSNNETGIKGLEKVKEILKNETLDICDITTVNNWNSFFNNINKTDSVIIIGGDGTLNRFVNECDNYTDNTYYFPCGNGNDFARDIKGDDKLIPIKKYTKKLPVCMINGKNYKFINGVGMGFDAYVCSKVNDLRQETKKSVNYVGVALKGVFGKYKTTNAKVMVDGKEHNFNNVWFAATMKGRFCGGGFMLTPKQNRLEEDGKLSLIVVHNAPKLKILYAFLLVFKGKHTKLKKSVTILEGYDIKAEFDKPSYLQIDGETHTNISSCHSEANKEYIEV